MKEAGNVGNICEESAGPDQVNSGYEGISETGEESNGRKEEARTLMLEDVSVDSMAGGRNIEGPGSDLGDVEPTATVLEGGI